MLYMVIERFKNGDPVPVYRRFLERGRMLPEGLTYVDSWVDETFCKCFQLMETDRPALLAKWIDAWEDLVEFETIPVLHSSQVAAAMSVGVKAADNN